MKFDDTMWMNLYFKTLINLLYIEKRTWWFHFLHPLHNWQSNGWKQSNTWCNAEFRPCSRSLSSGRWIDLLLARTIRVPPALPLKRFSQVIYQPSLFFIKILITQIFRTRFCLLFQHMKNMSKKPYLNIQPKWWHIERRWQSDTAISFFDYFISKVRKNSCF